MQEVQEPPNFRRADPKNGRSFCQTEMSQPEDVSVSSDGNTIAVADTGNNRVRLYTIKGQQLSVIGMRGKGNGQFDLPLAVVITPANLLVVGERNNARLQVGRARPPNLYTRDAQNRLCINFWLYHSSSGFHPQRSVPKSCARVQAH